MPPVQVASHRAQFHSQEHGRAQQLGNYNHERFTQDESVRVASLGITEMSLFNLQNASNQHTYQNNQD